MMSRFSTETKANIISISLSLAATFLITTILILLIGQNPLPVFGSMFSEVFLSGYGIGQTLFKATPLIICGCGLAFCFHASIFNIGAEGQLNAGAFTMALLALKLDSLPWYISIIICVVVSFGVSAFFGLIPALIKIKKSVSEVITTIMMNFIIMALINYFLVDFFAVKATMRTEKIPESMMLMKLSSIFSFFQGSSLNITFLIALILAFVSYVVIYKTKFGYEIRAVGFNPSAAKYIGTSPDRIIILTFLIGAGITSLTGLNFIMGYKGFYEYGFSNNVGFTAIAVALLARNNPIGIIFSALLFGVLDSGGLAVNDMVPKEIVLVVQGVIILTILSINTIVDKKYNIAK
jgi:simple sugar transport system permease protein